MLLLFIVLSALLAAPAFALKVCIIGSGIAGSSTAHFLRNYTADQFLELDIHVYERNKVVGGRMAMVELQGDKFEAGGSILHPKNLHTKRFAELLGLKKRTDFGSSDFAVWNGEKFVLKTFNFGKLVPETITSWINSVALLWRYGSSLLKMNSFVERLLSRFIYFYETDRKPYSTVPELLDSVSLYDYTQHPLDAELSREGLSPLLITELVTVISRINYGQNVSMSGLAGAVSLCGSGDNLWAVQGGNWQMAHGLIKRSNVSLHLNTTVLSVERKDDRYRVTTTSETGPEDYDAVIIATPLDESRMKFSPALNLPKRYMHHTFATFVRGLLNPEYFGLPASDPLYSLIATLEVSGLPFISISVLKEYTSTDKAYKIFSRAGLSEKLLNKLFSVRTETIEIDWAAYPEYKAPEVFAPILLDDNHLYYINSFENAASTMETSAVAAENVVRLLLSRVPGIQLATSQREQKPDGELRRRR